MKSNGEVTAQIADAALTMIAVDQSGFDELDRRYLENLVHKFQGGPVGVDNMSAAMSEERDTLEDVVEPYLIQQGYIMRTTRGRVATQLAWRYFGLPEPS